MLPSVLVPGLSQVIHGNTLIGAGFFLGVGTFTGIGITMLTSELFLPPLNNRLDTVIIQEGKGLDLTGQEATGRVEQEVRDSHAIVAYSFIGIGVLIYIWNIYDAGYPAQKNTVFQDESEKIASLKTLKKGDVIPLLYYSNEPSIYTAGFLKRSAALSRLPGISEGRLSFGAKIIF